MLFSYMNSSRARQPIETLPLNGARLFSLLAWLLVALTLALGSLWMIYKFDQLLFDNRFLSATPTWPVDLMDARQQIHALFAGEPVYLTSNSAVYPPATYFALWPLLGWASEWGARVVWALTTLASLGWLGWLLVRATGEHVRVRQLLLVLLPFVLLASGLTIGAGQLGNHVLPPLLLSLLLLPRAGDPPRWGRDLLVAGLFTLALIKPTFSAPFFWLLLFLPGRLRPALLVVALYAALTVGMSLFQAAGPVALLQQWFTVGRNGVVWGAQTGGLNNVQAGAHLLGLLDYSTEISLLILAAWGGWVFFYRRQNAWLLIGATAIVARLWIYHRNYDDMLLLLPLDCLLSAGPSRGLALAAGRQRGDFFRAWPLYRRHPLWLGSAAHAVGRRLSGGANADLAGYAALLRRARAAGAPGRRGRSAPLRNSASPSPVCKGEVWAKSTKGRKEFNAKVRSLPSLLLFLSATSAPPPRLRVKICRPDGRVAPSPQIDVGRRFQSVINLGGLSIPPPQPGASSP